VPAPAYTTRPKKPVEQIIKEQIEAAREKSGADQPGTELRIWKHRIVIGRDIYFAEAYFGFLFPFTHTAVYVEITKRKPARKKGASQIGFFLLKRRFILVQDPMKNFTGSGNPLGRLMPLKKVRLTTQRSPDLMPPANITKEPGIFFWPREIATGNEVNWEVAAEDEHGQPTKSQQAHLLFASNIVVGHKLYTDATAEQRTIQFDGSKVALARETPKVHVDAPPGAKEPDPVSFEVPKGPAGFSHAARHGFANRTHQGDSADHQGKRYHSEEVASGVAATTAEVDKVRSTVQDAVGRIEKWGKDSAAASLHEFHEQLERAEKNAASMATNAMTFGSRVVNMAKDVKGQITKFEDGLKDAKGDVDRLVKDLRTGLDEALKSEAPNLQGGHLANEIHGWFDGLSQHAGELAGAKAAVDQKAEFVQRKLLRLKTELGNLEKEAVDRGSQYFHTVMDKADVLIPALKDVLPDAPVRSIGMFKQYVAGGTESVRQGIYAHLNDVIDTGQKTCGGRKEWHSPTGGRHRRSLTRSGRGGWRRRGQVE